MSVEKNIKLYVIIVMLLFVVLLSACSKEQQTENGITYAEDDVYLNWVDDDVTHVYFDDTSITADDNNQTVIQDNQIEIYTAGTYVLEGTLTDGQVVVNTEGTGTVRLILNGASIHSTTTSAIYIKQADKTVISLEEGTENHLSDGDEYVYLNEETDEPSSALFSKDDVTINGDGNLTVEGNYNDAITSRDNLKIIGGTITVQSVDDGIVGRDLVALKDATIHIKAGGDGVKSTNDADEDKGNVILESGTLTIDSSGDGIQSENTVTVLDGVYTITSGGGSPDVIESQEMMGNGFGGMRPGSDGAPMESNPTGEGMTPPDGNTSMTPPDSNNSREEGMVPPEWGESGEEGMASPEEMIPSNGNKTTEEEASSSLSSEENTTNKNEEDTVSMKGIKATNSLTISGGTITIDANDDAIHSDTDIIINGGDIDVATGDDGIHADKDVMIASGDIVIRKSLEGIEGSNITFNNGNIDITAEDDGVNVNGGSDGAERAQFDRDQLNQETTQTQETEETGELLISGGSITVDANGDGLDSNTSITMTGGTVIVYGPTNNGNGALDYDQSFDITGGTLIAAGSAGMAQGVSSTSEQATMMMTFEETQIKGTLVEITDEDGNQIIKIEPEKDFQTIVISDNQLSEDGTYMLYTDGDERTTFEMSSMMTYVNESGVTVQQGAMQGGFRESRQ
ncbi:carbohydrate-binding domain-containing protein [Gracilibacillus marinus]|uniref:Carbohydrate-binding domain-containing protein n=1 Tax=Gracilibacillus marinus TaxID=630535 RepID=A0ABV8VQB8_9BACI